MTRWHNWFFVPQNLQTHVTSISKLTKYGYRAPTKKEAEYLLVYMTLCIAHWVRSTATLHSLMTSFEAVADNGKTVLVDISHCNRLRSALPSRRADIVAFWSLFRMSAVRYLARPPVVTIVEEWIWKITNVIYDRVERIVVLMPTKPAGIFHWLIYLR